MRLECEADPRAWAEVVDVWTRAMLTEFYDILGAGTRALHKQRTGDEQDEQEGAREQAENNERLKAYYRRVVKDARVVTADGAELVGVEAILEADAGGGFDNVDAAVTYFWANLPSQAYQVRQRLGNAKRAS